MSFGIQAYGVAVLTNNYCAQVYVEGQKFYEMIAVLLCLIMDIGTAYKLQRFADEKKKISLKDDKKSFNRQEIIFLVQVRTHANFIKT